MDCRPSVLILSTSRDRGALAAARALARSGWHVGVGTPDDGGMLAASNAVELHHRVARPRGDGVAFVTTANRALSRGRYAVIMGSGDDYMAATAAYRARLSATVPHPPYQVVRAALDKVQLGRLSRQVGLAVPATYAPEPGRSDADRAREWPFPSAATVVVKCREHWAPGQTTPIRIEAERFREPAEAWRQIQHIESMGARAIVQESIEGTLGALIGIFHDGALHHVVQQQTQRTWPTPNGASSRAYTVPPDPHLVAGVTRLLTELGWHGLVELQFITDSGGVPHVVDLNGRFYGSLALAERVRPGLCAAWARLALTGDLPPPRVSEPAVDQHQHYQWLIGDLRRALVERRGGVLRDVAGSLAASFSSVDSVFSLRDPRPGLHLLLAAAPWRKPEPSAHASRPAQDASGRRQQQAELRSA